MLIFNDTIREKAWTDESELVCWHYDHVSSRNVKGINLLNALYQVVEHSITVAVERVRKPIGYCDTKTRQAGFKYEVQREITMIRNLCRRYESQSFTSQCDAWILSVYRISSRGSALLLCALSP